jgi:hypothetical protein
MRGFTREGKGFRLTSVEIDLLKYAGDMIVFQEHFQSSSRGGNRTVTGEYFLFLESETSPASLPPCIGAADKDDPISADRASRTGDHNRYETEKKNMRLLYGCVRWTEQPTAGENCRAFKVLGLRSAQYLTAATAKCRLV